MFPYCCLLIICIMLFPCSVFKVHLSLFAQGSSRSSRALHSTNNLSHEVFTYSLFTITSYLVKSGGPKWTRFSVEKPRRLQRATGTLLRAAFRVHFGFLSRNAMNIERSRSCFHACLIGGPKWTRTTDLTIISRVL